MIDGDNAAFIQTGVAINLAACGADAFLNLSSRLLKLLVGARRPSCANSPTFYTGTTTAHTGRSDESRMASYR